MWQKVFDQWKVKFKNWVCLREKEACNNKLNVIFYFGEMLFEVRACIFVQLTIFEATSSIFVS